MDVSDRRRQVQLTLEAKIATDLSISGQFCGCRLYQRSGRLCLLAGALGCILVRYMEKEILLLGDMRLYQVCEPVRREELAAMPALIANMRDTILATGGKWARARHRRAADSA